MSDAFIPATGEAVATPKKSQLDENIDKVKVHFVAVGSAPILKKTKFLISSQQRFVSVTAFLRKMLRLDAPDSSNKGSSLFLYCNSAFLPGPEELVGDLRDCFQIRGELVIHYSFQVSIWIGKILFKEECIRYEFDVICNEFENAKVRSVSQTVVALYSFTTIGGMGLMKRSQKFATSYKCHTG